jgi:Xaa-Pro aminopeptidase
MPGDPALPPLTEHVAALKSEEFRATKAGFVSLSFPTIAGSGPNGAVIHYRVRSSAQG